MFLRFDLKPKNDDNPVQEWPQKRQKEKKRERKKGSRESSMLLRLRVAYIFNGQRNKKMLVPLMLSIYPLFRV
jgi:hypothetical protein